MRRALLGIVFAPLACVSQVVEVEDEVALGDYPELPLQDSAAEKLSKFLASQVVPGLLPESPPEQRLAKIEQLLGHVLRIRQFVFQTEVSEIRRLLARQASDTAALESELAAVEDLLAAREEFVNAVQKDTAKMRQQLARKDPEAASKEGSRHIQMDLRRLTLMATVEANMSDQLLREVEFVRLGAEEAAAASAGAASSDVATSDSIAAEARELSALLQMLRLDNSADLTDVRSMPPGLELDHPAPDTPGQMLVAATAINSGIHVAVLIGFVAGCGVSFAACKFRPGMRSTGKRDFFTG
eukprot:gnl/TRDRNA2_/TRDRNA2_93604_c0_seq1.p1 gnl/TRDRNA2_/TRDRNA2_93604_c0~~gnl/TRDRNA2_/TRDRNA2_93604_c0_seq1.p1  ORF type:complete len:299 (+),score=47.70 gnl/TRDRNA2_/TRDRNA2_93604_c0_seq1:69-965(+)